ncbi:c-type cytochrome [Flavobacterium algicola]|uniref:c-type cytochrome n=1 Tax=Flavobacterium algicola TaxID=556529 RepID=UPI001EFC4DB4|nr:c-type cytochrome [Flavobacterium algicola]MCG9790918.1 c-type cytochrome [Flavobacterium algicola]
MKYPNFQLVILILIVCCLASCQHKKEAKQQVTDYEQNSINIDLVALFETAKQGKDTVITVVEDPVYHKMKKYKAVSALSILNNVERFSKIDIAKTKIVFECKDGYKPEMPLQLFLTAQPFIAYEDLDATEGAKWETIIKNGNKMDAAPFYLVYPNASPKDSRYKWPYNLIGIKLEPLSSLDNVLYPKDDQKSIVGYKLFQKYCITCHAINDIGGTMGPELNYPKSVTEYWIEDQLVKYIIDPTSFRHKVKMPKLEITKKESEEIVVYLKYMCRHKKEN